MEVKSRKEGLGNVEILKYQIKSMAQYCQYSYFHYAELEQVYFIVSDKKAMST